MLRTALQKTGLSQLTKLPFLSYSSIAKDVPPFEMELAQLKDSWKTVVAPDLLAYTRSIDSDGIGTAWYNKVLQNTVETGEPTIGLCSTYTYKLLVQDEPCDTKLAHILGWCIELVISAAIIHDDICDQGTVRRGVPAWYRHEGVGFRAGADAVLVNQGCYHLLDKYFKEKDYYRGLLSNFHLSEFHIAFSLALELEYQKQNVLTFTEDNFNTLVNRKSWLSFLPLGCAMYLAGWNDPEMFRKVREIGLMGGALFQTQDDFLDIYGDPLITEKVGSDIQTNRCTWFSATAIRLASEQQKKILGECYGSSDPEKVAQVKQLYDDLRLLERYKEYEETQVQRILKAILNANLGRMETALIAVLNEFNGRVK